MEERSERRFEELRKGEFPDAFERLCAISLKPLASLKFKRDCLKAWKAKVASGFEPEQIIDAYAAYAKDYWIRNGDDNCLAKSSAEGVQRHLGLTRGGYNEWVTLIEYEHQLPGQRASAVLGTWCSIPNRVTTEVDASHLLGEGLTIILCKHLA